MTSPVDHFVCYKAKTPKKRTFDGAAAPASPKGVPVEMADHFQTRRYDLKTISRVCLPVFKSGSPVELKTGTPKPIAPADIRHLDSRTDVVEVVAVAHQRRRAGYWKHR